MSKKTSFTVPLANPPSTRLLEFSEFINNTSYLDCGLVKRDEPDCDSVKVIDQSKNDLNSQNLSISKDYIPSTSLVNYDTIVGTCSCSQKQLQSAENNNKSKSSSPTQSCAAFSNSQPHKSNHNSQTLQNDPFSPKSFQPKISSTCYSPLKEVKSPTQLNRCYLTQNSQLVYADLSSPDSMFINKISPKSRSSEINQNIRLSNSPSSRSAMHTVPICQEPLDYLVKTLEDNAFTTNDNDNNNNNNNMIPYYKEISTKNNISPNNTDIKTLQNSGTVPIFPKQVSKPCVYISKLSDSKIKRPSNEVDFKNSVKHSLKEEANSNFELIKPGPSNMYHTKESPAKKSPNNSQKHSSKDFSNMEKEIKSDIVASSNINNLKRCFVKVKKWGSHVVQRSPTQVTRTGADSSDSTLNSNTVWGRHIVQEPPSQKISPDLSSNDDDDDDSEEEKRLQKIKRNRRKSFKKDGPQAQVLMQVIKKTKPLKDLNQRQRLSWLRLNRTYKFWVQCCNLWCLKWRFINDLVDPLEIPDLWVCPMNKDQEYNSCELEEESSFNKRELIHCNFTAGSIVMAKIEGYPWWPAIIDDDPEFEQFYWLADNTNVTSHYHVVFLDEDVSRAWIIKTLVLPFTSFLQPLLQPVPKKYRKRLNNGVTMAYAALKLKIPERLQIYSFISRYSGPIYSFKHNIHQFVKKNNLPPYHDSDEESEKDSPAKNKANDNIVPEIESPEKKLDEDNIETNEQHIENLSSDISIQDLNIPDLLNSSGFKNFDGVF